MATEVFSDGTVAQIQIYKKYAKLSSVFEEGTA
jgi:hypothetical protein